MERRRAPCRQLFLVWASNTPCAVYTITRATNAVSVPLAPLVLLGPRVQPVRPEPQVQRVLLDPPDLPALRGKMARTETTA